MSGRTGGGRPPRSIGGHSFGGRNRLRKKQGRSQSSVRWLERQLNDPYVRQAQADGWRARAAFKLLELDARFQFLEGARRVVDLGAAPGSWTQVVLQRCPQARIIGIDLLPVDPIAGFEFIEGDFLADGMDTELMARMDGRADLVLSDMAANTTGHQRTDFLRTMALVDAAAEFAVQILTPGGSFVAKVLGGGAPDALLAELKRSFARVRHAKPPASRKESSETYLVAQGFRGRAD